jgi:hypothetical protein
MVRNRAVGLGVRQGRDTYSHRARNRTVGIGP